MKIRSLVLGAATVAAAVSVSAQLANASHQTMTPCTGPKGAVTFKVIPGSAGAGNIVYRLRFTNTSSTSCFVTGIPGITLLNKLGKKLPSHATFAGPPGTLSAIVVPLAPGHTASLTARFSPDIPGPGEPQLKRACEPTSYKIRVAPSGGGTVVGPILPPTPVCEHGSMQLTVFTSH